MDSLPDFDWYCETCLSKQKQGGSKTGERLVAPSTLGRSASFSSRSKSLSAQGGSRSRLTDRLNHKKPRIAPVRKSPSKAPTVQTTAKILATDCLPYPMAKKMAVESSSGAPSSVPSPAVSPQITNSTVRPLLTRENTFKSSPDTGKVKFLAPSAVVSFSGARANAAKSATLASQSFKAGAIILVTLAIFLVFSILHGCLDVISPVSSCSTLMSTLLSFHHIGLLSLYSLQINFWSSEDFCLLWL